ncbi:MAG: helix-turn-helix domain protein [Cyanobacteria bacterium RYN_339]|nr:helix-turn-helix domain protein [Cyanobacteria bacterium RYN_339]
MTKPDIAFRSYRREALALGDRLVVHGTYDGLSTAPLAHPHAQVLVPLAGRVHVGGHVMGPGEAVLILPGTRHEASTLGGELRFLAVNGPPGWLPGLAAACDLPAPPGHGLVALRDPALFLQAQQLAAALEPGWPEAARARYVAAGVEQLGLLALARPMPAGDALVLRVVRRVLADHAEDLTVEGLAREVGLGARQLERRFQAEVGLAPRRFLIETRLAAAREMLVTSGLGLAAIAERTGFKDASRLSRAFSQAMGQAPGAFRSQRLHNRG